jgi:hypothetical protein
LRLSDNGLVRHSTGPADTFAGAAGVPAAADESAKATGERKRRKTPSGHAVHPEAYELYLKGRAALRIRSAVALEEAVGSFQQALSRDPGMALAHSGLADAYALAGISASSNMPPREAFSKANAAATQALSIDARLAEPHASLARDFAGAERAARRFVVPSTNGRTSSCC